MVKRVRRLVNGTCEVARICGYDPHDDSRTPPHTPEMTRAFWQEWSTSKKLRPIFEESHAKSDMDVEYVVNRICSSKNIPGTSQTYVYSFSIFFIQS